MPAIVTLSWSQLLRRLGAALLAVAFLAAPAAFGLELWACRVMGTTHLSACCPGKTAQAEQKQRPTALEEAPCCAVLEVASLAPSVTRDSARADIVVAVVSAPLPVALAPPGSALPARAPPLSDAHPPTGPPLYVQHCSYLL